MIEQQLQNQKHNVATQTTAKRSSRLLQHVENIAQLTSLSGINSFEGFRALCRVNENRLGLQTEKTLDVDSRVLMTLMKLKLGLSFTALSAIFAISRSTCSREFMTIIPILRAVLHQFIFWPSKESIQLNLPRCFSNYSATRVILDCTEFPVFSFKCLNCHNQTYSHYKGRHTLKIMIGIAPSSLITFVSSLYGGKASDKHIFNDSGILDLLQSGNAVMIDKGFFVEKECAEKNVEVIRPAFINPQENQLSLEDAENSRNIASARVHIERAIERLKNFKILHDEITENIIPSKDVMIVICGLVNLSPPILKNDKF